MQAYSQLMI